MLLRSWHAAVTCDTCPAYGMDAQQVRRAVAAAVAAYGGSGCAARVAQAFGEHPETAVTRMRWARTMVARAVPAICLAA